MSRILVTVGRETWIASCKASLKASLKALLEEGEEPGGNPGVTDIALVSSCLLAHLYFPQYH